jgi:hypothetical protein
MVCPNLQKKGPPKRAELNSKNEAARGLGGRTSRASARPSFDAMETEVAARTSGPFQVAENGSLRNVRHR